MLWARKMKEMGAALENSLKPLLGALNVETDPVNFSQEIVRTALRFDMSRSATRMRRRLYAAWGKPWLSGGELLRLSDKGWEWRALQPEPEEVGDVHLDVFKIMGMVRLVGTEKKRLTPADRVRVLSAILHAIGKHTMRAKSLPTEQEVGVLVLLMSTETKKRVPMNTVRANMQRLFPQWGLTPMPDDALDETLKSLEAGDFIARDPEAPDTWALAGRLSFPW